MMSLMSLRSFRKKEAGFTLIELLIVIAIIGILAAIAIPNLLNALQRGKQKRTMSDMRNLATAVESYNVDNNVYPNATCPGGVFTAPVAAGNLTSASWTLLTPTYIAQPPYSDGWGHALFYTTDAVNNNYELASLGRNNVVDSFNCGTTTTFNDDIIYSDGTFLQWPEGPQQ
jgi:general secretion pathway protein G